MRLLLLSLLFITSVHGFLSDILCLGGILSCIGCCIYIDKGKKFDDPFFDHEEELSETTALISQRSSINSEYQTIPSSSLRRRSVIL